ncbi:MAG: CBN-TAG-203 protein [Benniella sp.]|nr:MAG: CBN-TAG-203 protein [Benniella sp.]
MVLYTVGIFILFQTKEDIDFSQTLEMHMRNEMPPLVGRDHLSYCCYYVPVKFSLKTVFSTVDGDVCEQYNLLSGRRPAEIQRKIEDMRIRSI